MMTIFIQPSFSQYRCMYRYQIQTWCQAATDIQTTSGWI